MGERGFQPGSEQAQRVGKAKAKYQRETFWPGIKQQGQDLADLIERVAAIEDRLDELEKRSEEPVAQQVKSFLAELPAYTVRRMTQAAERIDHEAKKEKAVTSDTFVETQPERKGRLDAFWDNWEPPSRIPGVGL